MDLIILPLHDWRKCEIEGFRTRDGHIMQHFSVHPLIRRILVVNRPVSLPELIKKRIVWGAGRRLRSYSIDLYTKVHQKTEKVFVLDIFSTDVVSPVLLRRDWWFKSLNSERVHKAIRRAAAILEMKSVTLFLWSPMSAGVIGKIDEAVVAFDALDNWLRHPEIKDKRGFIRLGYELVSANAGLIFVNSKNLQDFFRTLGRESILIKNGVDPNRFGFQKFTMPADLARIRKPIVGYAGKLAQRINVELVHFVADRMPEVAFVFIGPILNKKSVRYLFNRPNVLYLGDKHYDSLPNYVAHFDVAMIPHHVGDLENDGDPIKLYEYLAAGKPIVTTRIAGVDEFSEKIEIALSPSDFLERVRKLVCSHTNDAADVESRRKLIGEEHTWELKADIMVKELVKYAAQTQA
jgi:teichuronic acid biosynthesis glycosyltransferase TuaH